MIYDLNQFKKQTIETEEWLKKEFLQIHSGQASPAILDVVRVEVYGVPMSLKELASIVIEGARSLRVAPWDMKQVKDIEKAISMANLGVSTSVDEQGLRVNFPELTGESRNLIVKMAKDKMEEARRRLRRDRDLVVKDIQNREKAGGVGKDDIFRLKNEVQKMVDDVNKKLDQLTEKKEKEIIGQ
ncbi:MAG: hypothetical protein A3B11_01070 [Candidatus Taylorbacteria bacterium RIFCSPLOWO2_01_FULL_44_26]|uniref:Ribosome recycling factor domain-containing protein n=2 Tax=Candidatus Tayloriibacteriota TaxID=1817919 RepID=A0A1G2MJD7_9BACT|nr:MAG: hypothetical protein A3D50_00850 [Candidatus Taylorbacteria bacterium RIFCSPHIGHO2_02_FULL_44_12]OHA30693.1 MAG: hypothetical protein A3B11_01070 [Candidatus Taylorbacteria bacterium RIFCSPLOWO2_01_FULL_44_26]